MNFREDFRFIVVKWNVEKYLYPQGDARIVLCAGWQYKTNSNLCNFICQIFFVLNNFIGVLIFNHIYDYMDTIKPCVLQIAAAGCIDWYLGSLQ